MQKYYEETKELETLVNSEVTHWVTLKVEKKKCWQHKATREMIWDDPKDDDSWEDEGYVLARPAPRVGGIFVFADANVTTTRGNC